jgi:hypothetical protein
MVTFLVNYVMFSKFNTDISNITMQNAAFFMLNCEKFLGLLSGPHGGRGDTSLHPPHDGCAVRGCALGSAVSKTPKFGIRHAWKSNLTTGHLQCLSCRGR